VEIVIKTTIMINIQEHCSKSVVLSAKIRFCMFLFWLRQI